MVRAAGWVEAMASTWFAPRAVDRSAVWGGRFVVDRSIVASCFGCPPLPMSHLVTYRPVVV